MWRRRLYSCERSVMCLQELVEGHSLDDDRDDERVLEAGMLEVLSAVVEDEVDARHLLQRLEKASSKKSFADGSLEAVKVRGSPKGHLVSVVCFDFTEFFEQCRVRGRQTSETAQCFSSFVVLILFDEESRRLWEEQQAHADDD